MRDLSRNMDTSFRPAYHGGIVDVYRSHLQGEGYYYDVNSLYPTAMLRPMPVGDPTLVNLTPEFPGHTDGVPLGNRGNFYQVISLVIYGYCSDRTHYFSDAPLTTRNLP